MKLNQLLKEQKENIIIKDNNFNFFKARLPKYQDKILIIDGNVTLDSEGLGGMPVEFGVVSGNFSCSNNSIGSFKDFPYLIRGNLYASSNNFTDFKDFPHVEGDIILRYLDKIRSLEGLHDTINGDFWLSDCKYLRSFKGIPNVFKKSCIIFNHCAPKIDYWPEEVNGELCLTSQYGLSAGYTNLLRIKKVTKIYLNSSAGLPFRSSKNPGAKRSDIEEILNSYIQNRTGSSCTEREILQCKIELEKAGLGKFA